MITKSGLCLQPKGCKRTDNIKDFTNIENRRFSISLNLGKI